MAEKHGRELVDMLKESSTELEYYSQLSPQEREVDNHILQAMYFNYSGNNIAVVLVRWEARHKKHGPTTNYNLAVVNLGNAEISPSVIDDLVRQNVEGIPHLPILRTAEYIIVEGSPAKGAYEQLGTKPPTTAQDLANVLGQYINKRGHYSSQGWASIIPDHQMRISLGRGV